ncbi:MAG: LysR family transcriptional regulator [Devosia sp.]
MIHESEQVNWDDFKYFLALARYGRLSAAAATLRTTHVTVSNRVARLQSALNHRLFIQTRDGFRLTSKGKSLLLVAEECERQALLATLGEAEGDRMERLVVRIASTEGIGNNYFARQLPKWIIHNDIDVELISLPKLSSIGRREADIVVTMEEPSGQNIIKQVLTPYALGIYATRSYLRKAPPITEPKDLLTHRWIGYVEDYIFSPELDYHNEISTNLAFSFRSTSLVTQMEAALAGAGLAILPHYMITSPKLIGVLPQIDFKRTYWISSSTDLQRFKGQYAVWKFFRSCCERDRSLFTGSP